MNIIGQISRTLIRPLLVVFLAILLPGCAISQLTSGFGTGLFGKPGKKGENRNLAVSEGRLLAAAKSDVGGIQDSTGHARCPQFVVWPGDRLLSTYEPGREGDSLALVHRGEITKTARECRIGPGTVGVKYGIAGRVLLGPKGVSGKVNLPILVHVTDRDRNKIRTERITLAVNISKNDPIAYFSTVKVVKFPIKPGERALDYKLFVAFQQPGPR